jgi:hypothetical protein
MGAASYIVTGLGNPASFFSSSHGRAADVSHRGTASADA